MERMFQRLFAVVLVISMMAVCLPMSIYGYTSSNTYISEIAITSSTNGTGAKAALSAAGYTVIDSDLNNGAGGEYCYLGYKTTNDYMQAIKNIVCRQSNTTAPSGYSALGKIGNWTNFANYGTDGGNIYFYYTKNDNSSSTAISHLTVSITQSSSENDSIIKNYDTNSAMDMNKGCGKGTPYIYVYTNISVHSHNLIDSVSDRNYHKCSGCSYKQKHSWTDDKCSICGITCSHQYITDNGFCPCGLGCEEPKLVDDYYQIANYGNLVWLQEYVNAGNQDVNAILTADITANNNLLDSNGNVQGTPKYNWTPIAKYQGIFNGAGYTISGLYCVDFKEYLGLIGYMGKNSVAKNISIVDSFFGNEAAYYCGSITGDSTNAARIENCFSSASIKGVYYCGGITGQASGYISNCLYVGKISGTHNSNSITSDRYGYGTISNCYYIDSCGLSSNRASSVTAEQLASGEVCYNLNSTQNSINWYQNIDKGSADSLPVLNRAHYAVTKSITGYTNDLTYCTHMWNEGKCIICGLQCTHNKFENGFCSNCDITEEAKLVDDYYEIDNYGKLVWLQKYINNGNTSVNARLTADITANENLLDESGNVQGTPKYNWTPIGSFDTKYQGIFDGAGYNISGLYCVDVNKYCGLVGYLDTNGAIKNLSVTDSLFGNETTFYCGAIAGQVMSSTKIENCFSGASIKGRYYCGGIAGETSGYMFNCLYVGKISGANTSNSITSDRYGFGTISNCYYIDNCGLTSDRATSVTAEQLASGEVCYKLNSDPSNINWYQNIDKGDSDDLPTLKSAHYKVYDNDGKYSNILFGDINGNDKIDNADSALLLKYISGLITDINTETADVNNDGTIDILDVVKLIKKIA